MCQYVRACISMVTLHVQRGSHQLRRTKESDIVSVSSQAYGEHVPIRRGSFRVAFFHIHESYTCCDNTPT